MSTPAAAALNDAGASTTTTQSTQTPAANEGFWKDWVKPDAPDGKELKDWLGNKKFADPQTLVKSYREMEREASGLRTAVNVKGYPEEKIDPKTNTVIKPDENAVKAWRTAMGVPETADKYDIKPPDGSPYPQFTNYLKEVLHQAGAPPGMAKVLANGYEAAIAKLETELRTAEDAKSAADLKHLEQEWGSNYKERIALGARGKEWLAKEVGGLSDMQLRTMESVLGTSKFMSLMWKFGEGNKEPSFAGDGKGGGKGFEGGASAAQAEWDQLYADRTAGKITDYQWRAPEFQAKLNALVERIAAGNAN